MPMLNQGFVSFWLRAFLVLPFCIAILSCNKEDVEDAQRVQESLSLPEMSQAAVPFADMLEKNLNNTVDSKQDNKIRVENNFPPVSSLQDKFSLETLKSKFNATGRSVIVDVSEQVLYLYGNDNALIKSYQVSTAVKGTGSKRGSDKTPLGAHVIKQRFGDKAKLGTIFKARANTGKTAKILKDPVDVPDDHVTTRIMWLDGLELGKNKGGDVDSHSRYIYIHGTPEEGLIGAPASHGCIRMKNDDVVDVFKQTTKNTFVYITR